MGLTPEQQQLVEEHLELARIVAAQSRVILSFDERLAAAYFGLCLAAIKWTSELGEFNVFSGVYMRSQIKQDMVRMRFGARSKVTVVTGEEIAEELAPPETRLDEDDQVSAWRIMLSGRMDRLSKVQATLIGCLHSGMTLQGIARSTGRALSNVSRSFRQAKERLQA